MNTLTQELVKELFDYRDGELYWKKANSNRIKIGYKAGCFNTSGYLSTMINNKNYLNHRIVFLYFYGYLPEFLDHVNGNRADNRIVNLRPATKSQNNCNKQMRKDNTSGTKGVSWHIGRQKWQAQIKITNKTKYLGIYDDLELAELVITEARDLYHGEFARNA